MPTNHKRQNPASRGSASELAPSPEQPTTTADLSADPSADLSAGAQGAKVEARSAKVEARSPKVETPAAAPAPVEGQPAAAAAPPPPPPQSQAPQQQQRPP